LNFQGFRSEALIDLDGRGEVSRSQLVNGQLPPVVNQVLQRDTLISTLAQLEQADSLVSQFLTSGDLNRVSSRLSIGFRNATASRSAQLRVAFDGDGLPDELRFVESIAEQIAQHLAGTQIDSATRPSDRNNVPAQLTTYQSLDRAKWLVDQIEEGISAAKDQTVQLVEQAPSVEPTSAMHNVSHVRVVSGRDVNSLHQTLDSVDLASLKGVIGQIQQAPAHKNAADLTVTGLATKPIGAIPPTGSILLLTMMSLLAGSVIAWNIHPFSEPGFQNADEVADRLGVPIVAMLPASRQTVDHSATSCTANEPSHQTNWANQMVGLASAIVTALGVLLGGFWLLYPTVREGFADSVWHGLARIVWIFVG
jgi:sarcosine oxidase gamma subunit